MKVGTSPLDAVQLHLSQAWGLLSFVHSVGCPQMTRRRLSWDLRQEGGAWHCGFLQLEPWMERPPGLRFWQVQVISLRFIDLSALDTELTGCLLNAKFISNVELPVWGCFLPIIPEFIFIPWCPRLTPFAENLTDAGTHLRMLKQGWTRWPEGPSGRPIDTVLSVEQTAHCGSHLQAS